MKKIFKISFNCFLVLLGFMLFMPGVYAGTLHWSSCSPTGARDCLGSNVNDPSDPTCYSCDWTMEEGGVTYSVGCLDKNVPQPFSGTVCSLTTDTGAGGSCDAPTMSVTQNRSVIDFNNISGSYYLSDPINISFSSSSAITNGYTATLVGLYPSGTQIVDSSGNVLSGNISTSTTQIRVRLPISSVKTSYAFSVNISANYNVSCPGSRYLEWDCGSGVQRMGATITLSGDKSGTLTDSKSFTLSVGGLTVDKYDDDSRHTPKISGVKFKLYYDREGTREVKTADGNNILLTTNNNGAASVSNIIQGTYWLKEVEGRVEYQNLETPKQVTIANGTATVRVKNKRIIGDLVIDKRDLKNHSTKVKGVEFKLYKDAAHTIEATTVYGEKIKLVTDENGYARVNNLLFGTYYLVEVATRAEYEVQTVSPITINDDVITVPVDNRLTIGNLKIEKYDSKTNDLLGGIEFKLYTNPECTNEAKALNREKNDFSTPITIVTKANGYAEVNNLKEGTYYLKEISNPNSYKVLSSPIELTITAYETLLLPIKNEPIEILISKKDITGAKELEGALIRITDSTGEVVIHEFYSKSEPTLLAFEKGIYILTEVIAPSGYMPVESSVTFSVDDKGNLKILDMDSEYYQYTNDKLTILNETSKVIVSKRDVNSLDELVGAKFLITCDDGFNYEWDTGDAPVKLDIKPNIMCVLKEVSAPKGYNALKAELKFKVKDNGDVEPVGKVDGAYFIDSNRITVFNSKEVIKVPDTGNPIIIASIVVGMLFMYVGYCFINPKVNIIKIIKSKKGIN